MQATASPLVPTTRVQGKKPVRAAAATTAAAATATATNLYQPLLPLQAACWPPRDALISLFQLFNNEQFEYEVELERRRRGLANNNKNIAKWMLIATHEKKIKNLAQVYEAKLLLLQQQQQEASSHAAAAAAIDEAVKQHHQQQQQQQEVDAAETNVTATSTIKKKRGRPRKYPVQDSSIDTTAAAAAHPSTSSNKKQKKNAPADTTTTTNVAVADILPVGQQKGPIRLQLFEPLHPQQQVHAAETNVTTTTTTIKNKRGRPRKKYPNVQDSSIDTIAAAAAAHHHDSSSHHPVNSKKPNMKRSATTTATYKNVADILPVGQQKGPIRLQLFEPHQQQHQGVHAADETNVPIIKKKRGRPRK